MKKLILSISAFALVASYSAQVDYTDIAPDEVVNATHLGESYALDFDGGGTVDLNIFGLIKDTTLSTIDVTITGVAVDVLSSTEIVGGTQAVVTETLLIADDLAPGTTIDGSSTYSSASSPLFPWVGLTTKNDLNTDIWGPFAGAGMRFIGVKFMIGSDTHYGWVRVSVNSASEQCIIESYGYETTANTAIDAGATPTGTVTVVENPFKNVIVSASNKQLNILGLNGADVKIYSLIGNQVYNNNVTSDVKIDLSNQASGVYLVNYSQNGFTVSKKVVIK